MIRDLNFWNYISKNETFHSCLEVLTHFDTEKWPWFYNPGAELHVRCFRIWHSTFIQGSKPWVRFAVQPSYWLLHSQPRWALSLSKLCFVVDSLHCCNESVNLTVRPQVLSLMVLGWLDCVYSSILVLCHILNYYSLLICFYFVIKKSSQTFWGSETKKFSNFLVSDPLLYS